MRLTVACASSEGGSREANALLWFILSRGPSKPEVKVITVANWAKGAYELENFPMKVI